jgi:hypothetical protein
VCRYVYIPKVAKKKNANIIASAFARCDHLCQAELDQILEDRSLQDRLDLLDQPSLQAQVLWSSRRFRFRVPLGEHAITDFDHGIKFAHALLPTLTLPSL